LALVTAYINYDTLVPTNSHIRERIAQTSKIAVAAAALLLAATWFVWKTIGISSSSEPEVTSWLKLSECILLASAVLLVGGALAEWLDLESGKKNLVYKSAKFAGIIGILGGLLGDSGVFSSDNRLQELEGRAINDAKTKAAGALDRAVDAENKASDLAKENIGLEEALRSRTLLPELADNPQTRVHTEAMRPFAGMTAYMYVVTDDEAQRLAQQIAVLLDGKYGMRVVPSPPFETPFLGIEEGVVIYVTNSQRSIDAGKTMAAIFDDNLLGDKDQPTVPGSLTPTGVRVSVGQFPPNTPPDVIRIDVRSKPLTPALRKLRSAEPKK
jgi:hypothetical protein